MHTCTLKALKHTSILSDENGLEKGNVPKTVWKRLSAKNSLLKRLNTKNGLEKILYAKNGLGGQKGKVHKNSKNIKDPK